MERLDSMFVKSACSFPYNIAVTFNSGTSKQHVTYQELDVQASKVVEFLCSLCEKPEIIAVYSKQSVGLVACILGILRHQSCFASIDQNWQPEAICSFLSRLNVSLVLVNKEFIEPFQKCVLQWKSSLPSHDYKVELIRSEIFDANGFILVRRLPSIDPEEAKSNSLRLAYVMQSSGTTGDPKAVKVPHSCIVPNIADLGNIFQVVPDDVVFLASPYTFDPFVVQMFVAFATGARLVMVPETVKMVPSKLCEILFDEEKVTIFQPTPSLMHYIGQDLIKSKVLGKHTSLRVLAFGGESCPTLSTLRKWRSPGNNTRIYNLYGITEVSCWASCHLIPNEQLVEERTAAHDGNSLSGDLENIPVDTVNAVHVALGAPLLGTDIEIRDEHDEVVEEGVGQIYIGGSARVCLLGDETVVTAGTMRATGDWAYVKDQCIWFCGRKDRQIKRMGKRINLDWIECEISEKLLSSETCSLVIEKSDYSSYSRLHLFVVEKSLPHSSNKLTSLRSGLCNLLPIHAQPDFVHVVSHLTMTTHGKVDRNALLSGVQHMPNPENIESVREYLKHAWRESLEVIEVRKPQEITVSSKMEFLNEHKGLGHFDGNDVTKDCMFIASGGSSLGAIKLADSIESWISRQQNSPMKLPGLLDVILSKPFGALCCYVESKLEKTHSHDDGDFMRTPLGYINEHRSGDLKTTTGKTYRDEDMYSDDGSTSKAGKPSLKRKSLSMGDASFLMNEKDAKMKRTISKTPTIVEGSDLRKVEEDSASELKTCFCSVRRGNQWTTCKFCMNSKPSTADCMTRQTKACKTNCKQTFAQSSFVSSETVAVTSHSQSISFSKETNAPGTKVAITCQWQTCLYKCIDASPLVVYSPGRCEGEVFIGSHGHVFMCIRLSDGEILWERRVGDRIESSAALSACGRYVVVGCYDGKVYVFNRSTGETHWTYQTGAAVKSSPCIDQQTGVAWVGSHDQHLYGLDITNKQCLCAINCGGGSCFSSPCISSELHLVFIATLAGLVLAIDATEHTVLWSQQCPKPVFASPVLIPIGIVCPCVNGFIYCFDFQGKELWQFQTNAPVFCSPSYIGLEHDSHLAGYVVFGSHDKSVYCLSQCGEVQWCFTTDAQVYSSPFVAELNVNHLTGCHTTCQGTCFHTACHTTSCKKRDLSKAHTAVFFLSTVGTLYILELHSGVLLGSYSLPGEVFSSPVVVDKQIVVGCRNDYLYSLEMSDAK